MESIKIISVFKINEKVPFMTCIATDMEESEGGINLILESGESICIKDYSYYLLSLMPLSEFLFCCFVFNFLTS
ncbi:hypothetical protein B9P84_25105 [Citrobacter braakii]|nr:hypothetical protein B9P84_25105 [Citrobacter braakii]